MTWGHPGHSNTHCNWPNTGTGVTLNMVQVNDWRTCTHAGDFFAPHVDSPTGRDNFIGTLVVALPSEHTGGALVVGWGSCVLGGSKYGRSTGRHPCKLLLHAAPSSQGMSLAGVHTALA